MSLHIFGRKRLSEKYDNHHHNKLVDCLGKDVFKHFLRDDILIATVWLPIEQTRWRFGSQG